MNEVLGAIARAQALDKMEEGDSSYVAQRSFAPLVEAADKAVIVTRRYTLAEKSISSGLLTLNQSCTRPWKMFLNVSGAELP